MRSDILHHGYHYGDVLFGATDREWGRLMALGILFVALGTVGLATLFTATLASILYLGALLLIGGTVQTVQAFTFHGWRNIVSHLLMGALYLLAAYLVVTNPVAMSLTLTLVLAATLVGLGVVRGVTAVMHREYSRWGWLLFSGILTTLLGAMIMAQWPISGFWAIGLFVAIDLIFHGWSYIGLALAVKDAHAH
ncbi:MAG TPA: HdeD family acid-resistance protein [Dongiaceae bacterium]|nr:HdeD family acid-resistance protein [Dongiaceae bacterium]